MDPNVGSARKRPTFGPRWLIWLSLVLLGAAMLWLTLSSYVLWVTQD